MRLQSKSVTVDVIITMHSLFNMFLPSTGLGTSTLTDGV